MSSAGESDASSQLASSQPTCFLIRAGTAPATVVESQHSAGKCQPPPPAMASGTLSARIPGVLWRLRSDEHVLPVLGLWLNFCDVTP